MAFTKSIKYYTVFLNTFFCKTDLGTSLIIRQTVHALQITNYATVNHQNLGGACSLNKSENTDYLLHSRTQSTFIEAADEMSQ